MLFCFGIGWLQSEHQKLIVDNGALTHLVNLLKRNKNGSRSRAVIRRAAETIISLAHENNSVKTLVRLVYFKWFSSFQVLAFGTTTLMTASSLMNRLEGGIPSLVELLEFDNVKVQRAAAGALRTLAFKNDDNKNQVYIC